MIWFTDTTKFNTNVLTISPFIKTIDTLFQKENNPSLLKLTFMNIQWVPYKKFPFLKEQLENPFTNQLPEIFAFFSKVQRISFAIKRFIWIYRNKRAKIYNTEDLFMTPIAEGQKGIITVFENNTKYLFQVRELMKSILSNISHCSHFFPEPQPCKNPYTNLPFCKSNLYNIYYAIRQSSYIIPILIEKFFLESFDLKRFSKNHEYLINEEYLNQYVKTAIHNDNIRDFVMEMFSMHKLRVFIHKDFPRSRLTEIMRPYLDLYFKSEYYMNTDKSDRAYRLLHRKLHIFVNHNPQFGRKKVSVKYDIIMSATATATLSMEFSELSFKEKKTRKKIISFEDDHPNFYDDKKNIPFLLNHRMNGHHIPFYSINQVHSEPLEHSSNDDSETESSEESDSSDTDDDSGFGTN